MKWIKKYFIKKALKKRSSPKKSPLSLLSVKQVGVIAASLVELNETTAIVVKMLGSEIEVAGFFYGEGSDAKEAFSHKDFSLTGKPRNKIAEFVQNKADLIITSSGKLNIFSLYLLYLNPKSYSVGFYDESHTPYLDLMLAKEDMDQNENVENLVKYLKQVI